jgi:hypothetical protein
MSPTCGPYDNDLRVPQGLANVTAIYEIVPTTIDEFRSQVLKQILLFIGTAGFLGPVFCVMLLAFLYMQAIARKRKRRMQALEREVALERADKKFLIRHYNIKT